MDGSSEVCSADVANGREVVAEAERCWGQPVSVLTGAGEGQRSAWGVVAGIPEADGLMGDLGGGSLELVELDKGRRGRHVTLPLGPLRLMARSEEHTSELQSLMRISYAVFCLKKKITVI